MAALLLAALLALLWGLNMRRGVNHDEHQFIAGAAYMARTGELPYADFAYFHVPVLSLVYAALFRLNDSLLLTARFVSVLSAWLTLALLMWAGYRSRPEQSPWLRLLNGAAAAGLLAFTPLFIYTSGRAWNHDLPVLLSLAALLILDYGLLRARGTRRGLMVGLAGPGWAVCPCTTTFMLRSPALPSLAGNNMNVVVQADRATRKPRYRRSGIPVPVHAGHTFKSGTLSSILRKVRISWEESEVLSKRR